MQLLVALGNVAALRSCLPTQSLVQLFLLRTDALGGLVNLVHVGVCTRSRNHSAWKEATIEQSKRRFQDSVSMCVLTMRNLRQHSRVLPRNVSCEISLALRLLEEFFGLMFTRFWGFLGERGLVDPVVPDSTQR
ncbi:hypothetical protein PsorP6_014938 [Peronosclerospora sorghi]|uniref:Uncharacterized protein n=1 Tax=Peronosclerospora sorghi TaxID=230839 RepID=A0ACC0VTU5_9STRA|nr:hypothetical protein PsorP6_014938 [Peronosclerospora sorghi]